MKTTCIIVLLLFNDLPHGGVGASNTEIDFLRFMNENMSIEKTYAAAILWSYCIYMQVF